MDLLLWRHADAADGHPDHQRPLTDKGRAQAKHMAQWLNKRLPHDAVILVSPALRAQQTAQALKRPFTTCDDVQPGADAAAVLEAVGQPKSAATTLVVGHQPTLGQVAALLLTGAEGDLSFKKGAVWWLSMRHDRREPAVLRAMMTPQML
jgi:phosphohistidine phosphatase